MIIIKLQGGLGNQMFQFAFAYSLKKKWGVEVKFDLSWFKNQKVYTHVLLEEVFNIDLNIANKKEINEMIGWRKFRLINKVFNFILSSSYMQPHLHPGIEKIEKMYLLKGSFALIIFDEKGEIIESIILEKGKKEIVSVPAFTWHTYVMLTDQVIVYEEMEGVYHPSSWKEMASWAPQEDSPQAALYLENLKASLVA
jgi:cupin fold WbuC family metalloprotein